VFSSTPEREATLCPGERTPRKAKVSEGACHDFSLVGKLAAFWSYFVWRKIGNSPAGFKNGRPHRPEDFPVRRAKKGRGGVLKLLSCIFYGELHLVFGLAEGRIHFALRRFLLFSSYLATGHRGTATTQHSVIGIGKTTLHPIGEDTKPCFTNSGAPWELLVGRSITFGGQ